MVLPFAWLVGETLRRRPRLMPYFVVAHGLLDASVALATVRAARAYGGGAAAPLPSPAMT